ncbi:phosphatase PAP2 family protein [Streptomyces rhizosphaerihabitans]|uniref:phosphatase PAP2 family protein n=1 Tax=Streptomyces rhizosphaerihabitans TaxID=1266770 RepID=UPI0021BED060|nr:phosphatase PAP2 family protein [Streptomyces rhizosphaerihabitans]MCT9011659.1 phosphatase PAP2 family protein [Streptomyces rhizosphaerihabitans]
MKLTADVRTADRQLTQRAASRIPPGVGRMLSAVEETAESSKLWCGAAFVMGAFGGRRGRRSAITGLTALAVAQLVSNGVGKQLVDRPRPPKEWIDHDEVEDRPASSSFPSGHTAAAVAFTAAIAPLWPLAATACAVPAALLAVERVQSGAHYPTDVAAGALIGLAGARLTRHVPQLLRHVLQRPRTVPQLWRSAARSLF